MSEETMFLDASGTMICVGHVVRAPITINNELHGAWGEYTIEKAPGGYKLSYLRSEKGQILPRGYTGGYMADCLPDEDERDLKTLVFTLKPIRVSGWRIISRASVGRNAKRQDPQGLGPQDEHAVTAKPADAPKSSLENPHA